MQKRRNLVGIVMFIICLTGAINVLAQSPLVNNYNVHFHINPGAVVQVNGGVSNTDSCVYNRGDLRIEGDFINVNRNSIIYGADMGANGSIIVSGNWVNNGIFRSGKGSVDFNKFGGQGISGDSVTRFYDLEISGSGIKTLSRSTVVSNNLNLNDIELATDTATLYVTNTSPNAIARTSGFVSSKGQGWFVRYTKGSTEYLFPTGSSIGFTRYRPIYITPQAGDDFFAARMVNNNSTDDGYDHAKYDSNQCFFNKYFYHMVDHRGVNNEFVIRSEYDSLADKYAFNKIAKWNSTAVPNAIWERTEQEWVDLNFYAPAKTPSIYSSVKAYKTTTLGATPYILAAGMPRYEMKFTPEVCLNDTVHYIVSNGIPNNPYIWSITSPDTTAGGFIVGQSDVNDIVVNWDKPGNGKVSFIQHIDNFHGRCNTKPVAIDAIVHPKPVAKIYTPVNDMFEYDLLHFIDSSNVVCKEWNWDFGDGQNNDQQNPYHMYETPGDYKVTMLATSEFGCKDSTSMMFRIVRGADAPNVLTPNNDGYNDVFAIRTSGMNDFKLQIFNRWGNLIFETINPHGGWNGKTSTGEEAPEGTYYYIYSGTTGEKDYNDKGTVTLVR